MATKLSCNEMLLQLNYLFIFNTKKKLKYFFDIQASIDHPRLYQFVKSHYIKKKKKRMLIKIEGAA